MIEANGSRVLYCIVCAAPPAQQTQQVVALLQEAGWDVCHRNAPGEPMDRLLSP